MTEEILGIENLKKAVKFTVDLAKQFETSGKDGWSWMDSFSFIDEAMEIPSIAKTGTAIRAELKDLSQEELDALNVYIQLEFDLTDDAVEGVIEDALKIAFSIFSLIEKIRK